MGQLVPLRVGYHFNHTVNDLVVSSCVRTFLALISHAVGAVQAESNPVDP
jgi:hypothetical protein